MSIEEPRQCRESELQETLAVLDMIFHSSKTRRMGKYYPYAYGQGNLHNMRIMKADDRIISHAAIYPRFVNTLDGLELKVGCIGGVATHPDYRGKGYATAVLNDCIRKMKREDYDISILWTDSPDFYRRLGWESAGTEFCFNLNPGNVFILPAAGKGVREEVTSDFSHIRQIYELKPLRSRRESGDYPLLFNSQRRCYCRRDKKKTAYVLLGDDNSVLEYGGDTDSVCSILRNLVEQGNCPFLKLFIPPHQDDMLSCMEERNVPKNSIYLGMIRVISRKKILGKYKGGTMQTRTSDKSLSKLLFGPERKSKESVPFTFYVWQSEHC